MTDSPGFPYVDSCTRWRPAGGADEDGDVITGLTELGQMWGAWGSASSVSRTESARMNQQVDAVFASQDVAQVGDTLVGLHGHTYVIEHFHETVMHTRYFLRLADG